MSGTENMPIHYHVKSAINKAQCLTVRLQGPTNFDSTNFRVIE